MNADTILSVTKCGDLFPYDKDKAKARYKELVKQWHPDISTNSKAFDVFAKINELYSHALLLLENGQWEKTGFILINKEDGKKIALNYDAAFDFELGTCFVSRTKIVYLLREDKEKYYNNAIKRMNSLHYEDRKMRENLSNFLPEIYQTFKTNNGEYVIVFDKPENVYCLKTIFEYYKQQIEGRHVAWMLSRLCNLTCYLKFSGLVHNGININNCFVSPENHSIYLLGGWWYTTKENENMIGTTKDIFDIMPIASKGSKKSSALTDIESVKLLGRQLLGETNCRKLLLSNVAPQPFIDFLTGGSGNNPYEEFAKWDKALSASYGKRKFIKMEIDMAHKK